MCGFTHLFPQSPISVRQGMWRGGHVHERRFGEEDDAWRTGVREVCALP